MPRRLAIVGGGWSGLAAAVRAVQAGCQVVIYEMSHQLGGRARTLDDAQGALDNGQHILIGAYVRTLALMRDVGADPHMLLKRLPLALRFPDGTGLALQAGAPMWSLLKGMASFQGCTTADKFSLLRHAAAWAARGFRCADALSVDALCAGLSPRVRQLLIDPLCVAAMNTHAHDASAQVFLRVLHDALLGARGSADLLLPQRPLSELLPRPAALWLSAHGVEWRLGHRVQEITALTPPAWAVDGEAYAAVVLACSAHEAARLTARLASGFAADTAPSWVERASGLRFEPIVTVYVQADASRPLIPITALRDGPDAPAQFVFDLGQLGRSPGLYACVVSGAQRWVDLGLVETGRAALKQLVEAFPVGTWRHAPELVRTVAEKRATFRCTPGLLRPAAQIAPGLVAAGDYTEGAYPATLEGAVRSGERAVALLCAHLDS